MNFLTHLAALTDGTLILASTERVARHLKLQSSLLQSVDGNKAWFAKGKILTITSWLESAWHDLMPDEQLLYPVQELAVVKSVIDQSGLLPANMISSTNAARRISQAYSLVHKYQIPMDRERFAFKDEFEAFFKWKEQLDAVCAAKQFVFRAHLPARLLQAIDVGLLDVPEKIVIVGMIDMNPAERAVFQALQSRGSELIEVSTEGEKATPRMVRAHNAVAEYAELAKWVGEQLAPYVETPLAAPTIAILVADLRTQQTPLLEALSLHASPGSLLPAGDTGEVRAPWDISSGATLGSKPMIRAAMDILSLTPQKAELESLSRVLRSRWISGSMAEGACRALLDVWLRQNMGLNMGGNDFLRAIAAYKGGAVPDFRARFAGHLEAQITGASERYPSEWAEHFNLALEGMGWPGQRELDSAAFQTLKAWEEALALFRTLDGQLGTVAYARAFMWLREIVDTRQFQPRIAHVAPVSILGYEDAIGLSFDAVWVLGAANTVLPERAEPSPFIPTELQIAAGIAEASSEATLIRAQKVVAALLSTSESVTVSCASHNEKGAPLGASELFGSWPATSPKIESKGLFIDQMLGTLNRTVFDPETVPAVSADELTTLKGGVAIFKNYAESPFFAFVKNRLQAEMFPVPVIGLDPQIQGTMVHLVLELFWRDVRTSEALKAMNDEELFDKVQGHVGGASEKLLNKLIWRYGARLISLEQMRLCALVVEWLELEKLREFEFEVLGFEEPHEIKIGELSLTVRIDRRDRVFLDADKKVYRDVVHDYKTGNTLRKNGLDARKMTEPQLPIYATQIDLQGKGVASIDGVSLAQVNSKSLGFHTRSNFAPALIKKGKGETPPLSAFEDAWHEQCHEWSTALGTMSSGFIDGLANLQLRGNTYPIGYEYLADLAR
ncbi:PD-(D/E)XK nuclease family protein [Pseudomonas baetica]|uniref:PD-(D/E)XK nuclease family protein n=1 Tax=Pseudomonas baetica TaxID=674054 RepID=UPI002405C005|nr:PD-(D/E)XK nuclease family protein [Pseudomonas baetica]MDF9779223.1 putative DNA repair protein [Pseudomonas baetica]